MSQLKQLLNQKKNDPVFNRRRIGSDGEEIASLFLKRQGYEIIDQNYRCRLGEIDFVAKDRDTLVFVEVKTRQKSGHGLPQESVTKSKQQKISKVAITYLKQKGYLIHNTFIRFDVVAIHPDNKIDLIKNAFLVESRYTI